MGWNDDEVYLGESLRGLQRSHVGMNTEIGAQQQLRGALAQLAGNHFNQHAPMQRTLRSPYKDSTQIAIKCTGQFTLNSWNAASPLPQVNGLTRVYQSFKPEKAIVTELVRVTFHNSALGDTIVAADVDNAGDTVLVQAFAGSLNCFPNAPNPDNGIPGPAFAFNALGNGISWPTINGGIDMSVAFALEDTVLYRAAPPAGYTSGDITSVVVTVRITLMGPSLR
jgi:hypothetical protein